MSRPAFCQFGLRIEDVSLLPDDYAIAGDTLHILNIQNLTDIASCVDKAAALKIPSFHVQLHASITVLSVVRTALSVAAVALSHHSASAVVLGSIAHCCLQTVSVFLSAKVVDGWICSRLYLAFDFGLDAKHMSNEVIFCLLLMHSSSVLRYDFLHHFLLADPAHNRHLRTFGKMRLECAIFHLGLAVLARNLDFRDDPPCYFRLVPRDIGAATARTVAELFVDVLNALFAEDLGAAGRLDC